MIALPGERALDGAVMEAHITPKRVGRLALALQLALFLQQLLHKLHRCSLVLGLLRNCAPHWLRPSAGSIDRRRWSCHGGRDGRRRRRGRLGLLDPHFDTIHLQQAAHLRSIAGVDRPAQYGADIDWRIGWPPLIVTC